MGLDPRPTRSGSTSTEVDRAATAASAGEAAWAARTVTRPAPRVRKAIRNPPLPPVRLARRVTVRLARRLAPRENRTTTCCPATKGVSVPRTRQRAPASTVRLPPTRSARRVSLPATGAGAGTGAGTGPVAPVGPVGPVGPAALATPGTASRIRAVRTAVAVRTAAILVGARPVASRVVDVQPTSAGAGPASRRTSRASRAIEPSAPPKSRTSCQVHP